MELPETRFSFGVVSKSTLLQAAYFQRVNLSAQGFYKLPSIYGFDYAKDTKNNADGGLPFNYFTQACLFPWLSVRELWFIMF